MSFNFSKRIKTIRHSNSEGAATSTITPSNGIDTQGFDSVEFEVLWGAITGSGVQSVEVHTSSDDGDSDSYTALAGTNISVADDDDNGITIVDIHRPPERYVKCIVNRATQNSAVDGIVAHLYNAREIPITEDSTVTGSEFHNAPIEGTA